MSKFMRTPKGRVEWAKVVTPDFKFDKAGIYSCDFYLKADDPATQEMCAELDELVEEAKNDAIEENPKRKPLTAPAYEVVTDDDGNETGEIKFKFKLKAQGKTKEGKIYKQRPAVLDSKGTPVLKFDDEGDVVNDGFRIGNGTTAKIAFEPRKYFMASSKTAGVSLRLKAIKLIKLEAYAGGGSYFEEEEEEDGYVAKEDDTPVKAKNGNKKQEAFDDDDEENEDF